MNNNTRKFGELYPGDYFLFDRCFFIKIENLSCKKDMKFLEDFKVNCITLEGMAACMYDDSLVTFLPKAHMQL